MLSDMVRELATRSRNWSDVRVTVRDLSWHEPRSALFLKQSSASLHVVLDEIGGRAEFRHHVDRAEYSGYFGSRPMAYLPAEAQINLFADEIRELRLATFEFAEQAEPLLPTLPRIGFRDERLRACAELLTRETLTEEEPEYYGASLARALTEALSRAVTTRIESAPTMTREAFDAVVSYVSDHLEESIPINTLAAAAGLDAVSFTRAFIDVVGETPQRWQMEERIRWAQRLMLESPAPSFKEIARWTGFSDQSHFSRTFNQIVGRAPRSWLRERH